MTRAWKPGDVAVATVLGSPNQRVIRGYGGWSGLDVFAPDGSDQIADLRPLVVLDLDDHDRLDAAACIKVHTASNCEVVERIARQIEAQTRAPRPEEPTGLGAVVEDRWGHRFVMTAADGGHWWNVNEDQGCTWQHIDAVRVLSEGVQP